MAKKTSSTKEKIAYSQANRILPQLNAAALHDFMLRTFPNNKVGMRNASVVRMCCPIQAEASPSFDIDTSSGTIFCYGCHYRTKNFLKFLEDTQGISQAEAASRVRDAFNISVFSENQTKELEALNIHQQAYSMLMGAWNSFAQRCYHAWKNPENADASLNWGMLSDIVVPTLTWLFETRGHDPGLLANLSYGIVAPPSITHQLLKEMIEAEHMRRLVTNRMGLSPERREAIFSRALELITPLDTGRTGYVSYHYGRDMTTPSRIRVRRPDNSSQKDVIMLPSFEEGEPLGFFGLYSPAAGFFSTDAKRLMVLVVEGENDALSLQERLLTSGKSGILVIAAGGSSNNFDHLCDAGFEVAHLVADQPTFGNGNKFIENALVTTQQLEVKIFNKWAAFTGCKDPDDAARTLPFEDVYDRLVIQEKTSYITTHQWALTRVIEEVAAEGLDEEDIRAKVNLAARFGKCVRNPAQMSVYIEKVGAEFKIPPAAIRQEIVKTQESEPAYIIRIAEILNNDFHLLCYETDGKNTFLIMYHRASRRILRLPVNDGEAAATALASIYGEIPDYFENNIGLPARLHLPVELGDSARGSRVQFIFKELASYIRFALQRLFQGALDRRECDLLSQGTFWVADPADKSKRLGYIVNGDRVYKFDVSEVGGKSFANAKELDGPSDNPYIFDIGFDAPKFPYNPFLNGVEDIHAGNDIDVYPAMKRLAALIDKNWKFRVQIDSKFIAYELFANAIDTAFKTPIILAFKGEPASGKSMALSLFAGNFDPKLRLLMGSNGMSNYTVASLYQRCDRSTLPLVIDEFEDENEQSHKSRVVTDVSELIRNIVSETGVVVERGSRNGTTKTYRMKISIIMAYINSARKAQDDSRRFEIETVREVGRRDPWAGIIADLGGDEAEWEAIKRAINLGMIKHIPEIIRRYAKIERECMATPLLPFPVPTRFLKNYFHVATLMDMFGEDWKAYIIESCTARAPQLQAVSIDTSSQELFDRILRTPGISSGGTVSGKPAKFTVVELMQTPETWPMINSSSCGFFFLPEEGLAVIDWVMAQAQGGILSGWKDYAGLSRANIKDRMDRHPDAIRPAQYTEQNIMATVKKFLPAASSHTISVLGISKLMDDLVAHAPPIIVTAIEPVINNVVELNQGTDGVSNI